MNCTTATRMPWPMARRTMPNPELDLPLPGPVLTTSTPRSICAAAMRSSTTAFLCCILRRWRSASDSLMAASGGNEMRAGGAGEPGHRVAEGFLYGALVEHLADRAAGDGCVAV